MATIIGDNGDNTLIGTDGDDIIDGRGGADRMSGLNGSDTYIVDNAGDEAIEEAGGGWDEVRSSISFTLGDFVESLVLTGSARTGTGNSGSNLLVGNAENNILRGLGGNDTIEGGEGADLMIGGTGDDQYVVDNVGDTIEEVGGHETVMSTVSFDLGEHLEDLYLEGGANVNGTGNNKANSIGGNEGNNHLRGLGGNDFMSGGEGGRDVLEGGEGNDTLITRDSDTDDTLIGGAGDDRYDFDKGDTIIEMAGGGRDGVEVHFDFTLGENSHIEDIHASGPDGGPDEDFLILIGNSADNLIEGYGVHTMRGGGGNDVLDIRSGADRSFLYGGAGNDLLIANNGDPWDHPDSTRLDGGSGNDSYDIAVTEQMADIVEGSGGGIDTVYTRESGTLSANLENLILAKRALDLGLSFDVYAIGNGKANRIVNEMDTDYYRARLEGKGGNDYLQGMVGTELYFGGQGADKFAIAGKGTDFFEEHEQTIVDFRHGTDEILLDNALFANLGATGALKASAFRAGTAATTANHRVIFDAAEGALYYDSDGTGAQEQFFILRFGEESTAVDATDFVVV